MGKAERVKGRAFEQKIARVLQYLWPGAKRGWQFRGGQESCDIIGTPIHWECSKGGESIWAKWKQAQRDCKKEKVPIVIKQRDREKPVVLLSLKDFLPLLTNYEGNSLNTSREDFNAIFRKEFGTL